MRTRWPAGLVCLALGLAGCARDGRDGFAFRNPFDTDRGPDTAKLPAASTRAATRVNFVGSEVAARSKDALGVKPVFFTMGVPEVEISHHKSGMVIVSEGLVERCPTDTELAAVLCHELGKLAAEQPANREADREAAARPFTPDLVGGRYDPDMTRLAAEAKFDRPGPRAGRADREARAEPRALAERLFVNAGYKADEFARVDPLVHEAEDNADRRASERGR